MQVDAVTEPEPSPPVDLAGLLLAQRDQIVAAFVREIERQALAPPGLSRSLLVDHVPDINDEIVAELERLTSSQASQEAADTSDIAREHGRQRWTLGYDLQALMREYDVLRGCILQAAKRAGVTPSIDEFDVLARCLSVGVAKAAEEYIRHRDAQADARHGNLEFLAQAGQLLTSSLDYRSTLSRLTTLLVPRLADWCVVHLEDTSVDDMPIAHVDPAKVEVIRDIFRRYPPASDSSNGYPYVARTGEPQLIPKIEPVLHELLAQSEEHLELLRTIDSRSCMVVPLQVQGHLFGALTLAYSVSGRHYDAADLLLANEVARRAAAAIDNARLYELSQDERSRVEAATRAKDEFVAMVSHELRTPLNAILGWIRLVRSGSLDDFKRTYAFDVIERNAEAQNRLVSDLLDISRIFTGKLRIDPAQVDLGTIVELVIEGVLPAAEGKRIRIERNIDRDNSVLRGDGDRLEQVVWNLLANAIKFTPKDGVVRVSLQRIDSDLELEVEDNGIGIEPGFLQHVFESFRQSDTSATRTHGGLGIGLSIAKHIVELHGGAIRAESAGEGRGATFSVRLPVSPLVSSTLGVSRVPATTEHAGSSSLPAGLGGIRVLVVDDEPDARELIAYLLETCGMKVQVAGSAAEALALLASDLPDVVVSDIGMPDEDGYSLIRSIRTLPRDDQKGIPAIALTAYARNEDRTRALVEGFNVYMSKPVEPATLAAAVAELAGPTRR
jgi:signal transduction histidine kinase